MDRDDLTTGLIRPIPPPPFPMPDKIHPYVQNLVEIAGYDNVEKAVAEAVRYDIAIMKEWGIKDADSFLKFASGQLAWIPLENHSGNEIYFTLCLFYFILDREPLLGMQTEMKPENIDKPISPVSQWISGFAVRVGDFMDTTESFSELTLQSFSYEGFNMEEAEPPEGGFRTFNQLFCRRLKKGLRDPFDKDNPDPKNIVWPADCKFDDAWDIDSNSMAVIKTIPWPIDALLGSSKYANAFAGGVWMHAFLGPQDYHRQHAPVGGHVVEAKVIQGQAYLDVQIVKEPKSGKRTLQPIRRWQRSPKIFRPPGHNDPNDLPGPDPGAPDGPGYEFLQTRGCIIIDNPIVGLVAVLPIGMAYVSSVKLSVKDIFDTGAVGLPSFVNKGDEISCFQFGGSDIVLCFQAKANVNELVKKLETVHHNTGDLLVKADPRKD